MRFRILVNEEVADNLVREWVSEHEGYYGRPHGVRYVDGIRCGYAAHEGIHSWTASSGNRWEVQFMGDGTAVVQYEGRRHGQTRVSKEVIEGRIALLEYDTTCPELPIWGTAT